MPGNYDTKSLIIDSGDFNKVVNKLRTFFIGKGFIEVHTQNRLSILAACEDPYNISTYEYAGQVWPLPQTGQMWLEYELLKNPDPPGYFCVSTSYRNEKNPVPGRHDLIFPMFEFELHGGMEELKKMEIELLTYLGYKTSSFYYNTYSKLAEDFMVKELEHNHENKMYEIWGPVGFITDFPEYTSPFWNMKRNGDTANKIDVILSGHETIGSAERETDVDVMRERFNTISDGDYAKTIFDKFGKDRTLAELEEFLSYNFIERSGGGIGITRLIRSMKKEGLI